MITCQIETITPAIAADYLKLNTENNRKQNKSDIDSLAEKIRCGKWAIDGTPIRFSEDGKLIDGQHRLQAVIRAGLPIESVVIRGLPRDAFKTIDTGRGRTGGDILFIDGCIANPIVASSAISGYMNLLQDKQIIAGTFRNTPVSRKIKGISKADILDFYRAEKELVDKVARDAASLGRGYGGSRIFTASFWGAYFIYLVKEKGYDYDFVIDFARQVVTGRGICNDIIVTFRNAIINHNDSVSQGRRDKVLTAKQRIVYFIKTWNCYVTGDNLLKLQYKPGYDDNLDFLTNNGNA